MTTCYEQSMQNLISERRPTMKQMSPHRRRPHRVQLKPRLQITQAHQTWTKLTELQSADGTADSHHELTNLQQLLDTLNQYGLNL